MPRLMSVAHTADQVVDRSKTVTRRVGWVFLRVGDLLWLCRKVQGRAPDEPLDRLALVRVTSVRREPLEAITPADVVAEGFPGWSPEQFVEFFRATIGPVEKVTRIEFKYLVDVTDS